MVRNKFIKSSTLPVCLLSATLAFGVSPIYNKVYAAEMATQQTNTIKGKVRCVFDNGDIAVNLDNGEFVMKYGYPNVKIGDILDFEI